jgi:hypothetical protein
MATTSPACISSNSYDKKAGRPAGPPFYIPHSSREGLQQNENLVRENENLKKCIMKEGGHRQNGLRTLDRFPRCGV